MDFRLRRDLPTFCALSAWAVQVVRGDGLRARLSIFANPFFRRLTGLDRPLSRRTWRHPLVWFLGSSALLAGVLAGVSINEIHQSVASWPNPGAVRGNLYFNTIVTPFMFAMGFIATAVPIVSFFSLCRQIANGTIEHFVMTPPGWRAILQARAAHVTLRTTILVAGMMLCAHALNWHYQFYNKNDVWIMTALLAILPFCAFAAGMISLYWALRYYHVRAFAFGGLLVYQVVLYAAVGVFVATTAVVMGIREDLVAVIFGVVPAILIFYGLGKVYWGRLMELTRGPAMEHLATGRRQRAQPFGAAPWWRIDLLRRLWPLKTWVHLRFMTHIYLLIMLVLMIPVSLMKSLGTAGFGATALIAGLPFFLCLTTLPRHWAEAQASLPRNWAGDLPDHSRDIPPYVMLQILLRPWQVLFALFGIGAAAFAESVFFTLVHYWYWRNRTGFLGGLNILLEVPAIPLLAPGLLMGGTLFALLYLRFIIVAVRRPGDASTWRMIVRPVVLFLGAALIFSLFLMPDLLRSEYPWGSYGWKNHWSSWIVFRYIDHMLSVTILAIAWIFFGAYARLSRHILDDLREMKDQPPPES